MAASVGLCHHRAVTPRWRHAVPAILLAGSCQSALALGVGEPQLLSGFGEPLRVRVPVNLDSVEERTQADAVQADLIPESEYPRYGVAEQSVDVGVLYAASRSADSRAWIEIGSRQDILEPAAILLLRVRLGATTIVKEVPLLFDFNPSATATETPEIAAADAAAAPPASAAITARAAAAEPPATPVRARSAHRPRHQARAEPAPAPAAPVFQLSPGLRYSSFSAGLRLAENFDSLSESQRAHPQPQTPPAPAPAAPAPAPAAARPAEPQPRQPAPAPRSAPADSPASRPTWVSWSLAAALLAGLWLLSRRRGGPREPRPAIAPAAAAAAPQAMAPLADDPAAPIRDRLRKLSRGKLDHDLARRVLLVDAFLDLRRYDSAERLLQELERELAEPVPRPEGRADVAAAVRR